MKKIFNFHKYANSIFEQSLSKEIINRFDNYLYDSSTLNVNLRNEIKILKTLCEM